MSKLAETGNYILIYTKLDTSNLLIKSMFVNYPKQNYNNINMKFIQYPDQIDLAKICRNIENKTLILDPDFQRDYVWTKEDASKLIESLLLDIPVLKFLCTGIKMTKELLLVVSKG